MRRKLVVAGAVALASMMSLGAVAHELYYIQGNVGALVLVFFPINPTDNWRGDPNRLFFGCGDGNDPAFNLSFGGVCFGNATDGNFAGGGSHLVGTSTEVIPTVFMDAASITFVDDQFQSTVEAYYCQDINGDAWCGGNLTDVDTGNFPGTRDEPDVSFCGSVTVYSPLADYTTGPHYNASTGQDGGWYSNASTDPEAWGYLGDGATVPPRGNWEPTKQVLIFMSAVVQGTSRLNVCGNQVITNPVDGSPVRTIGPLKWATKGFVEHA